MSKKIDLNEKIGKLLDLSFDVKYWLMNRDETGVYSDFDYKKEADSYLEENLKKYPEGLFASDGVHVVKRYVYPGYKFNLETSKIVVDAMGKKGFWLKLTSPFMPTDELKPRNPEFHENWKKTKNFWYASFDFHGTTDTRPPWQGGSENPAEAIVLAAIDCIEGNPEVFGKEQQR